MLITLPISELVPGMYVNSVTKQQESVDGIKIKTSGLVRDKSIIQRLITEGVLELLIDFTKSDVAVPAKYKEKQKPQAPVAKRDKPVKAKVAISLEQEFAKASVSYDAHNRKLQSIFGDLTSGLSLNIEALNEISNEIVSSVFRNEHAMTILTRIKDKHSYNWRHMINCTIFTAVFAKYLT